MNFHGAQISQNRNQAWSAWPHEQVFLPSLSGLIAAQVSNLHKLPAPRLREATATWLQARADAPALEHEERIENCR